MEIDEKLSYSLYVWQIYPHLRSVLNIPSIAYNLTLHRGRESLSFHDAYRIISS